MEFEWCRDKGALQFAHHHSEVLLRRVPPSFHLLLSLILNLLKITSQGVGDMLELDQVHPVTGYTGGMATP